MWGIHSLGQPQSPLFIRFYMHLRHMFVLVPETVGFLTSNMKGMGPLLTIPAFQICIPPLTRPSPPTTHSLRAYAPDISHLPVFVHTLYYARLVLPTLLVETVESQDPSRSFSNFSTPMRPFHIHLIWQSSATQVISYFHHRVFC